MIFEFGQLRLDTNAVELRGPSGVVPLEPKCFALLKFLVEERARAVPKEELFEAIWSGVFVTDGSLSTAVKQLRAALGDDGRRQEIIKTVRGIGFRFVAPVTTVAPAQPQNSQAQTSEPLSAESSRPTVAIRPFQLIGADPLYHAIAEAIPSEIIATLSRLRWLNVIARGSSFRFTADASGDDDMAARLGAQFLVSGSVEWMGPRIALFVQVSDARSDQVIWSDRRTGALDEIYEMRAAVARDLSNALELGLSRHEAERLSLLQTENLDAWGHYHLGIRHMYRYNAADNEIAARHFEQAVVLDPGFSRAHGGLSYTEFQNAFQYFGSDRQHHIDLTLHHAEEAVRQGESDPFCNLMYGRARWLADDAEGGLVWVDRSIALNPNYALGYYNNATLNTVLCDGAAAEVSSGKALFLSPMDPQLQSMYGTRALAALISDDLVAARQYADRALHAPNPHLYVFIIAAAVFRRSGDGQRADQCIAAIQKKNARFGKAEFLTHFNLRDAGQYKVVSDALSDLDV